MGSCGCKFELTAEGSKIVHCNLHGSAQYLLDELKEIRKNLIEPMDAKYMPRPMFTTSELRSNISRLLNFLNLDN